MKSLLITILWRLGVGLGISVLGLIASFITGNWNIAIGWISIFGTIMIILAILPFIGGVSSARTVAWQRPASFQDEYKSSRDFSWPITCFLIALPNFIVSYIVFRILH